MDQAQWIQLARRRLLRVLARRRYASARQLEKKISEAGPPDIRPDPFKLYTALGQLQATGQIIPQPAPLPGLPTFYSPRDFGGPDDEARKDHILHLYRQFQAFNQNHELCGSALEAIVDSAAIQADRYTVFGSAQQGQRINGVVIERECDHILSPRNFDGPAMVLEDKNMREWLHPSAEEIWAVIGNSLRIPNTIPVIICRKLHFLCYSIFTRIGMMGWQVFRQYFNPRIEADLAPIRHTDGLGFADITTSTEAPRPLVNFLSGTLPNNAAEFQERFEQQRQLLTEYAIAKKMETRDLNTKTRSKLFEEFMRRLPEPRHWKNDEREEREPPEGYHRDDDVPDDWNGEF
jgi:hypothetical protein